jgi:hypothetical protein
MTKSTITKITSYANSVVAKSHNKRIICSKDHNGNIIIELVRILSKDEQLNLKDAQPEGNQYIVRGKVFVTSLMFTPETFENLRIFMNVFSDLDNEQVDKLIEN